MAIATIGAGGAAQTQSGASQSSAIGQEDFLKILLTQLNYQDPLKPLDNQQFLAQMAQFSSLEQSRQLNERIDTLLTIQSSSQSIGLLGKTVDVLTESGAVTGQVTALTFKEGQPVMTVKVGDEVLTDIGLSQIMLVREGI
ncbi:MAG: flagellar hook capping FlgD N-terminal domain-containing protein [Pseudomonadota bacterium]